MPFLLALPELLVISGLIVAFGLIYTGLYFVDALLAIVRKVSRVLPLSGFLIGGVAEWALQKLSNKMGEAADSVGAMVASSWHFLATVVDRTGWAIYHVSEAAGKLYWHIAVQYPLSQLWARAQDAYHLAARAANHLGPQAITRTIIQKADLSALKKWVHAQIAAIPHAIAHAGAIAIPIPHSPLADLTGWYHRLTRRVGKLEARFGRSAFTAAVATALATLGVSWARKSCAKRTADGFCKVDPDVFAGLIAGLAVVVGAQSVVRFANGMLAVEDEFVSVLERMIVELGDVGE